MILTRTPHAAHLYHGSANLSASAWGRLSLSKPKGKTPAQRKLTVANWECGVLVPLVNTDPAPGISPSSSYEARSPGSAKIMLSATVSSGGTKTGKEKCMVAAVGSGSDDPVSDQSKRSRYGNANEVISAADAKEALLQRWGMALPFVLPARKYDDDEVAWTQALG